MANLPSLDRYKRRHVKSALIAISGRKHRTLKADDEIIRWIDAQFANLNSPLSKLFADTRLDRRKIESWKVLLWVLSASHFQSKRLRKLEFPERREFELLRIASENRERRFKRDGKRLTIREIAEQLRATKPFGEKTVQGNKEHRTAGGIVTQIKKSVAKYRRLLEYPTMVLDDEFARREQQKLGHFLFVLSDEWRRTER